MVKKGEKRVGTFLGFLGLPAVVLGATLLAVFTPADAAPPRFTWITNINNKVQIHFDTEPNRTYVVQYINRLPTNISTTNWSNLYTALSFPISTHQIIQDVRTTPVRFYRLKVTP